MRAPESLIPVLEQLCTVLEQLCRVEADMKCYTNVVTVVANKI